MKPESSNHAYANPYFFDRYSLLPRRVSPCCPVVDCWPVPAASARPVTEFDRRFGEGANRYQRSGRRDITHLAVNIDGSGVFDPDALVGAVQLAEQAGFTLVTLDDSAQPPGGALDA